MSVHIYGQPASIATKKASASTETKVYGMNYPLGQTTKGYFAKASGARLVKNNLRQLLGTDKGERVMLPNYGTRLKYFLFEPLDQNTFNGIKTDILGAIQQYALGVDVVKLTVLPSQSISLDGVQAIEIQLRCQIESLDNQIIDVQVEIG